MLPKLLTYLKHEEQLISEMINLSQKQQRALVKYDIQELDQITAYQDETSKYLKEAEDQRINLLMAWLKISKKEAVSMWLSDLENVVHPEELTEVRNIRLSLSKKLNALNALNTTNRLLSNRAKNNVGQMLSVFANGNHVCNVRV
jgi:hypothetical protein